jgi:osmoprotectant transport system permease protein
VLLLLVLLALAAAALPFVNYAPNRLVSGKVVQSGRSGPLPPGDCLYRRRYCLSFLPHRLASWLTLLLTEASFCALVWCAGRAASDLAVWQRTCPYLGSGLWLWLALSLLASSDAIRRLTVNPVWRWLLHAQIWILPLWLLLSGQLDSLSLLKEYANRQDVFNDAGATSNTVWRCYRRWYWGDRPVVLSPSVASATGVCRECDSDRAVRCAFWLLIAPLAGLVAQFPWLGSLGVAGTGITPALIALVLYALLPLVRGVVAGLNQVPADVLKAPKGWG